MLVWSVYLPELRLLASRLCTSGWCGLDWHGQIFDATARRDACLLLPITCLLQQSRRTEMDCLTSRPVLWITTFCSSVGGYNLHGGEAFLRSKEVLSYSRISPHFMEPEGSLPHSQEPATSPYPETDQPSPCPPSHFSKIHINIILSV